MINFHILLKVSVRNYIRYTGTHCTNCSAPLRLYKFLYIIWNIVKIIALLAKQVSWPELRLVRPLVLTAPRFLLEELGPRGARAAVHVRLHAGRGRVAQRRVAAQRRAARAGATAGAARAACTQQWPQDGGQAQRTQLWGAAHRAHVLGDKWRIFSNKCNNARYTSGCAASAGDQAEVWHKCKF